MGSQMEVGWAGIQSVSRFFSWYFEWLGQNKSAKTVRSKETGPNFGATFSVELQSLDHFLWGFLPGMCDRLVPSGQCQSHLQLHFRNPHKQLRNDRCLWQSVQRMCAKYLTLLLSNVRYRNL